MKYIIALIILGLALCVAPALLIWAVNTLVVAGGIAGFHIPFTFMTWLAVFVILLVARVQVASSINK